jgi:hypothetical protein
MEFSMSLNDRTDELNCCTSAGREWFIGYEFTDNGEQVSTVIDAFSKKDALERFEANFWRIAFGDPSGKGPNAWTRMTFAKSSRFAWRRSGIVEPA